VSISRRGQFPTPTSWDGAHGQNNSRLHIAPKWKPEGIVPPQSCEKQNPFEVQSGPPLTRPGDLWAPCAPDYENIKELFGKTTVNGAMSHRNGARLRSHCRPGRLLLVLLLGVGPVDRVLGWGRTHFQAAGPGSPAPRGRRRSYDTSLGQPLRLSKCVDELPAPRHAFPHKVAQFGLLLLREHALRFRQRSLAMIA
jgi:hypothetical protein